MTTVLLAFVFMLFMVTAMAIGVLFGRKPISGSCGGMKALGMDVDCEICGGDPSVCKTENTFTRKILRSLGRDQGGSADTLSRPAKRPDRNS